MKIRLQSDFSGKWTNLEAYFPKRSDIIPQYDKADLHAAMKFGAESVITKFKSQAPLKATATI